MAGSAPSSNWLERCQLFDDGIRKFDVQELRRALRSPKGRGLVRSLEGTKERFEEAFSGVSNGLQDRKNDARNHRRALDGYRSAGDRQRGGPKFIKANL